MTPQCFSCWPHLDTFYFVSVPFKTVPRNLPSFLLLGLIRIRQYHKSRVSVCHVYCNTAYYIREAIFVVWYIVGPQCLVYSGGHICSMKE